MRVRDEKIGADGEGRFEIAVILFLQHGGGERRGISRISLNNEVRQPIYENYDK